LAPAYQSKALLKDYFLTSVPADENPIWQGARRGAATFKKIFCLVPNRPDKNLAPQNYSMFSHRAADIKSA
jgi:hypothetical protein